MGEVLLKPKIKYRTKYESAGNERVMSDSGFNISHLGDYLLKSDSTPDEVKEAEAEKMKPQVAKTIAAHFEAKRKAGDSMAE
eukprot:1703565-Prymnesium_polylepis.1